MKYAIIKVIALLVISNYLVANNPGKDFLITLNGSTLTGTIKEIGFSNGKSRISFENDFGDTYLIHPATISGFAFKNGAETFLYESKFLNGKWQFLKVEMKGQVLSLYSSSERQLQFTSSSESPIVVKEKNTQIWLQFAGDQPFKLNRGSYKRILRDKMESNPDLAKRIGKRGFRYNNLREIVELYNKLHRQKEKAPYL